MSLLGSTLNPKEVGSAILHEHTNLAVSGSGWFPETNWWVDSFVVRPSQPGSDVEATFSFSESTEQQGQDVNLGAEWVLVIVQAAWKRAFQVSTAKWHAWWINGVATELVVVWFRLHQTAGSTGCHCHPFSLKIILFLAIFPSLFLAKSGIIYVSN